MDSGSRYLRLRREHLSLTLRELSRRQQGAVLAIAAFLGPFVIAFVHPAAEQVAAAVMPGATLSFRIAVLAGWFALSSLLVLSLREAVFMLRARPFLASLPIRRGLHFRADLRAVATAYSLLWLFLAYAGYRVVAAHAPLATRLAGLAAFALAIGAILALQAQAAAWLARSRMRRDRGASRWPARSALALPILVSDVPQGTVLRVVAACLAVGLGALMSTVEGQCARAWPFFVVEAVLVAWALQRLPAVVDERATAALPFLFRLPHARRRALAWSLAVILAGFSAAMGFSTLAWRLSCDAPSVARAVEAMLVMGAVLAAVGVSALRFARSSSVASIAVLVAAGLIVGNVL